MEHAETLANGLGYVLVLPNDIALGVDLHIAAKYQEGTSEPARADLRELISRWSLAGIEGAFAPQYGDQMSGCFHGPADLTTEDSTDSWTVDLGSALASVAFAALLAGLEAWVDAPAMLEALAFRME